MSGEALDLALWLLEQISEDENRAHYALTRDPVAENSIPGWGGWWLGHYQHYHRWSPERVLAECEAKRRIIALHTATRTADMANIPGEADICEHCSQWDNENGWLGVLASCPTLRLLALPYADRNGYDESWRP